MKLLVIGTGCDKCTALYRNTLEAVAKTGLQAEVSKVEDLMEIVKLGVMTSPSLMADGKLLVSGRVASAADIAKLLQNQALR